MEKKVLGMMVCLLFICTDVVLAIGNITGEPGKVRCISETELSGESIIRTREKDDPLIFEFHFTKPTIAEIQQENETITTVTIEELPIYREYGMPCLPVKPLRILLPQGKKLRDVDVITSEAIQLIENCKVQTAGGLFPVTSETSEGRQLKYLSSYVEDFANSEQVYSVVGTYSCRGFQIIHVNIFPVQYHKDTGELSYFSRIKLTVETDNDDNSHGYRGLPQDKEYVKRIIDNPAALDSYHVMDGEDCSSKPQFEYIVITSESFKNSNGEYTFQDLIESKISKGMSAGIFTVDEIVSNPDFGVDGIWGDRNEQNPFYETEISSNVEYFDDTPARIRNFIRYAYSELGTTYVLLGGDADEIVPEDNIVPFRGLFADEDGLPLDEGVLDHEEDDIPSDVYYACLNGNFNFDCDNHFGEAPNYNDKDDVDEADLYAEVVVGRACADSLIEISNFVKKTLWYDETDDPYLSEILFIGEYLGFPGVSAYGGNYKDHSEEVVDFPEMFNVTKIYDREDPWDPNWLICLHLSETSYHLINHDGHGNHNHLLKTSGDNIKLCLTNEKPFFIYSHSCLTGSFDNWDCYRGYQDFDCVAEVLTCEMPNGAFACILNARYGLGSEGTLESPSGVYDESFYSAIFHQHLRELGFANHFSKEDNIWRINENGMRWCYYQTNLFGDPQLQIKSPVKAPDKPFKPSGSTQGKTNNEYSYVSRTTDPQGDQIFYFFDWGDGRTSGWLGPYESGEECTAIHAWETQGSFNIKVKAKDILNHESEWSDPLTVSMPKVKNRLMMEKQIFKITYIAFKLILDAILLCT